MTSYLQEKILSSLNLSKEKALDEITRLSAYQKLSEFLSELEYFEKKYKKSFKVFDRDFKKKKGSYTLENDWLSWKFAAEGYDYWNNLVERIR